MMDITWTQRGRKAVERRQMVWRTDTTPVKVRTCDNAILSAFVRKRAFGPEKRWGSTQGFGFSWSWEMLGAIFFETEYLGHGGQAVSRSYVP